MVCDGCGRENAPGAEFCANTDCRSFLGWGAANSQPPPASTPAGQPTATQPGPTRPGAANPPKPLPVGDPGPAAPEPTLGSAVRRRPAKSVEPSSSKPAVEPSGPTAVRPPLKYQFIRERQAPVAVEPLEETQPQLEASPGQTASDGRHGLWFALDQREVSIVPGEQVAVTAQVLNKGTVVEGVDMRVLGLPTEWVTVDPPRVNLDVGGQAVMTIRLAPPKVATTVNGLIEVEVALWSASNPQVRCAQHLRVDVGAFHELEINATPRSATTRRKATYIITAHNRGNYPLGVGVEPSAGAAMSNQLLYHIEPRSVGIPAGETASIRIGARTGKWHLTGTPIDHTVALSLVGAGKTEPVELNLTQQPILPHWTPTALKILLPLLALTVGALAFSWLKARPHKVPNVVGEQVALAQAQLGKAGFKSVQSNVADPKTPQGLVLAENPGAGSLRRHGAIVSIAVSSGPPQVALMDLSQLPEAQARDAVTKQGLVAQEVREVDPNVPAGLVISQQPPPGTSVTAGSTVRVTVSAGPPAISVPSIVGLSESNAIALLGQVNLRYAKGGTSLNDQQAGSIVSQSPPAGTVVSSGSTVTAMVAGPTPPLSSHP